MLSDVAESVRVWLARMLPAGTTVSVSTAFPRGSACGSPRVHAFLGAVSQEPDGAAAHWSMMRDLENHPLGRTGPSPRYRLLFLITARCADPVTELDLLGAVLTGCAWQGTLPRECLRGRLADLAEPIVARCAPDDGPDPRRRFPLRTVLPLTLLVPLTGGPVEPVAPPPRRVRLAQDFTRPPT